MWCRECLYPSKQNHFHRTCLSSTCLHFSSNLPEGDFCFVLICVYIALWIMIIEAVYKVRQCKGSPNNHPYLLATLNQRILQATFDAIAPQKYHVFYKCSHTKKKIVNRHHLERKCWKSSKIPLKVEEGKPSRMH